MVQQDYILRILQQFLEVLSKLINNDSNENSESIQLKIGEMYTTYFNKSMKEFQALDSIEIIEFIRKNNYSIQQIEMLSELIYATACVEENVALHNRLYVNSLVLFIYTNKITGTFSMTRHEKIQLIQEMRIIDNVV